MAHTVLINGNGFDVNLGLKSGYSDFIKEEEWGQICSFVNSRFDARYQTVSLLMHLIKATKDSLLWFDIENEIHKFIKQYPHSNEVARTFSGFIEQEFIMVKNALYNYLKRISKIFSPDTDNWSYILLKKLQESSKDYKVFTFNYTNCFDLCGLPEGNCIYIHGNIKDKDIVLGCEELRYEHLPDAFSFLLKSNMINRTNNIIEELYDAYEVIFFGHSLNEFDFFYFDEFFSRVSSPIEHPLYLTFITRNKETELEIRNNIRKQNIQVHNLFKSNIHTNFIHTEAESTDIRREVENWESLLTRISL